MKPLLSVALAAVLAAASIPAYAQTASTVDEYPSHPMSAEEAAGLPDLKAINRPAAQVSSKVEISPPRLPSYYEKSTNGTEITEFRVRCGHGMRRTLRAGIQIAQPGERRGRPSRATSRTGRLAQTTTAILWL